MIGPIVSVARGSESGAADAEPSGVLEIGGGHLGRQFGRADPRPAAAV